MQGKPRPLQLWKVFLPILVSYIALFVLVTVLIVGPEGPPFPVSLLLGLINLIVFMALLGYAKLITESINNKREERSCKT